MFIGYIQSDQDQASYANQYQRLISFAQEQGFILGCVHSGNSFENLKSIIQSDCEGILINKISYIGPYLQDIKNNLQFCQKRNLKLFSVDDGYKFEASNLTEDFFKGMDIAINIRRNLISQSTKKVLKQRQQEGKKLGRPIGAKVKSKLENNSIEIMQMLKQGISKSEIARKLNINRASIYAFAKRHGLTFNRGDK